MPSDSGETRSMGKPHNAAGVAPPLLEQEQLPCPRCQSTNTKFCYYNNYNFSQPRHFCKSCRRYWTHGGTLRDIPIGGGSRKSAKRSRTSCAPAVAVTNAVVTSSSAYSNAAGSRNIPLPATPILLSPAATYGAAVQFSSEMKGSALSLCGSFTSLLNNNTTATTNGPGGFLGLGGFGLGLGSGFEEVGFGLGRAVWPFSAVGDGAAGVGNNGGPAAPVPNTWQLESLQSNSGFVSAGDCFAWPDLAISTLGNSLK